MTDFDYIYTEEGEVKFKVRKQLGFLKRNLKYWPLLASAVLTGVMVYSFHTKVWPEIKHELEQIQQEEEFEAALASNFYDLETLTNVDMSRKEVSVDVFIGKDNQVNNYRENKEIIFKYVSDFYSRQDIDLTFNFVDAPTVSTENRTKQLSIEILKFDDFINRTFEVCNLKTTEQKDLLLSRFFNDSGDTTGMYYKEKNALLLLAANRIEADYSRQIKFELPHRICTLSELEIDLFNPSLNVSNLSKAKLIAHELGHAFGLGESHEFLNDSVPEFICEYCQIPNLMSYQPLRISNKSLLGSELNEFQKTIMHSYLSKGQVYKQLELVGFDSTLWSFAVKQTNVYISKEDVENFEKNNK